MKTTTKLALTCLLLSLASGVALAAPAAENWDNLCASCHGSDGKGQTKQGKKLKLRDYTTAPVQAELKDEEMLKAITGGIKENGKDRMKSFKEEISADEIKDLVAYIRKFKT
jgi:cytochrome c6